MNDRTRDFESRRERTRQTELAGPGKKGRRQEGRERTHEANSPLKSYPQDSRQTLIFLPLDELFVESIVKEYLTTWMTRARDMFSLALRMGLRGWGMHGCHAHGVRKPNPTTAADSRYVSRRRGKG